MIDAEFKTILQEAFGITALRIEKEARAGWSADAYKVFAAGGNYFFKVYDKTLVAVRPWIARIDAYTPALRWLARQDDLARRVVQPVSTRDGGYKYEDARHVYLVYRYIEGQTVGKTGLTATETAALAEAVAALHGYGAEIPVPTDALIEDTSMFFCTGLMEYLQDCQPDRDAAAALLLPHREMLMEAANRTLSLRDEVRAGTAPLVLCHTDLHGWNLMRANGDLLLIDWEGLCLAPPEADLFMFAGWPQWEAFLDAYGRARPEFRLNPKMLAFYLIRRQVEDLWADVTQLLYDAPDAETAAAAQELIRINLARTETMLL